MASEHLSYRHFKNIFGDLGVTAWTKFNWFSNGLPDGEYNGITKVTLKRNIQWVGYDYPSGFGIYVRSIPVIEPDSTSQLWGYGFSNLKILQYTAFNQPIIETCIAVHPDGSVNIHIEGLNTFGDYMEYLDEHPIILYYYDRNVWGGVMIPSCLPGSGDSAYFYQNQVFKNVEIRDVRGDFEYIDVHENSSTSLNNYRRNVIASSRSVGELYFKDISIQHSAYTFNNKWMPRAVVYKLSSAQALSLAPQLLDEPMEEPKVAEVVKEEKYKDVIFSLDNI